MPEPAEVTTTPKPRRKADLRLVGKVEKAMAKAPALPATRPVLIESQVKRLEWQREIKEVAGEISVLDAAEAQAIEDFDARIALETKKREAVRTSQARRRADLMLVHEGLAAALRASGGDPADVVEGKGRVE